MLGRIQMYFAQLNALRVGTGQRHCLDLATLTTEFAIDDEKLDALLSAFAADLDAWEDFRGLLSADDDQYELFIDVLNYGDQAKQRDRDKPRGEEWREALRLRSLTTAKARKVRGCSVWSGIAARLHSEGVDDVLLVGLAYALSRDAMLLCDFQDAVADRVQSADRS